MHVFQFTRGARLFTYIMCLSMVCQRGHGYYRLMVNHWLDPRDDHPMEGHRQFGAECQVAALRNRLTEQVWKRRDAPFSGNVIQTIFDTDVSNSSVNEKRIVGGEIVDISIHPYQVVIIYGNVVHCGGSIISENFVLTAAHCIVNFQGRHRVRAGSSQYFQGGVIHDSQWVKVHPSYTSGDFDVGLICVARPFQFGRFVQPVALVHEDSSLPFGEYGVVTGWGKIWESGPLSYQLRKVKVPIYSSYDCKKAFGWLISDRMFCAGYRNGRLDACLGDSGGPLVVGETQIGIVSWGVGCARPKCPGVYTNIAEVRSWIAQMTGV